MKCNKSKTFKGKYFYVSFNLNKLNTKVCKFVKNKRKKENCGMGSK